MGPKLKGVKFHKASGKYRAWFKGHIVYCDTLDGAVAARKALAKAGEAETGYLSRLKGTGRGVENKTTGIPGISYIQSQDRYLIYYKRQRHYRKKLDDAIELLASLKGETTQNT